MTRLTGHPYSMVPWPRCGQSSLGSPVLGLEAGFVTDLDVPRKWPDGPTIDRVGIPQLSALLGSPILDVQMIDEFVIDFLAAFDYAAKRIVLSLSLAQPVPYASHHHGSDESPE